MLKRACLDIHQYHRISRHQTCGNLSIAPGPSNAAHGLPPHAPSPAPRLWSPVPIAPVLPAAFLNLGIQFLVHRPNDLDFRTARDIHTVLDLGGMYYIRVEWLNGPMTDRFSHMPLAWFNEDMDIKRMVWQYFERYVGRPRPVWVDDWLAGRYRLPEAPA